MQIKLSTEITNIHSKVKIGLNDKVLLLGSCFTDSIGQKLVEAGFNVMINPFGVLYNIESIYNSIERLTTCRYFTSEDCIKMGSGLDLICSFSHHSSFARKTEKEFLDNANMSLKKASAFWKESNKVIITLGSAFVWRHSGKTVANCLKLPGKEFSRELLSLDTLIFELNDIITTYKDKEFIFSVSPIRHLGEFGAHSNTISKSLLHISLNESLGNNSDYFPSYEILLDELRDYRFYAKDLLHPSELAIEIIWEKFLNSCVLASDHQKIKENIMANRQARHNPLH